MRALSSCGVVMAMGLALVATASPRAQSQGGAVAQSTGIPTPRPAGVRVSTLVAEAETLSQAFKFADAQTRVTEAMTEAERDGDRVGLAMAHAMQGTLKYRMGLHQEGILWFERALRAYESLGDRRGIAYALSGLSSAASAGRDVLRAREWGTRALQVHAELADDRGRARVLLSLVFSGDSPERRDTWLREALEIAERLGDDGLKGGALKHRAATEFAAGNLSAAQATLESAIAALDRAGDTEGSAAASIQLGRVHRAHGDDEGALGHYERAIALLPRAGGHRQTLVEAVNASAIALDRLGRQAESLAAYERGLAIARESGNPVLIDFMVGNLAGGLVSAKKYSQALAILRDLLTRDLTPYVAGFRHTQVATALGHLGRHAEALESANESIRIARQLKQVDTLPARLDNRVWMLTELGRYDEALTDAREAIAIIDQIRTNLVPVDFLKRGYGDSVQKFYASGVDLLSRLDRGGAALAMAEQGRARAFLDLLAARESIDAVLLSRGDTATPVAMAGPPAGLRSDTMGRPVPVADMVAIAKRLGSTLLSYWVGHDMTLVWVMTPDGRQRHARVAVSRERLARLVAATTAPLRPPEGAMASRGQEEDVTALPLRGIGLLALSRDDRRAWRDLHTLLIEPVQADLPARGGRVTIVPHGPLFQLSFAALRNAAGRYMIEDYDLHYAPAISMLDFTGRRQQAIQANAAGPWALVGDPAALPVVGGTPLAPLPGAARELAAIAAIAPGGRVVRLNGASADEALLSRALDTRRPSVVHFATHGFAFDDAKTPPFLALNRRGNAAHEDGRLTGHEVYGLTLSSDLVVLSACRTGAGPLGSDGIVGLTRGFFYAGAPSVMATFWDVTDDTTAILMPAFYRAYARDHKKGASLRAAQLALLADLRAGRVVVSASGRRVTLPEHPLLWAAFFLSGEP